jgi:hypothetical protein
MSDENYDPSSIPTKIRSEPIDTRSTSTSSYDNVQNQSSLDSPKSATIINVSQRLPSTSVEISVSEILSTNDKHASVSILDEENYHSISSHLSTEPGDITENPTDKEQSKMDLGEATRELTRLLHIRNDNKTTGKHLNPDAPDFKPIDISSTYRSELAPAHSQRRATQSDFYDGHHSRTRYYSESQHNPESLTSTTTSTIKPLLSIVPQYIPHHRKSWTQTTPLSLSSSNAWWPQEYSNTSSAASSYHSRPAYQIYSPLMEQQSLTDENNYSFNQQQHKYPSKRPRAYSGRAYVYSNQTTIGRKRSHSGPETPLPPPPAHLNGIHSLTRIMVDLLRLINPIPEEQKELNESISSTNLTEDSPIQNLENKEPSNEFIQAEHVIINNEMSRTAAPPSSISVNKTTGSFILIRCFSLHA